MAKNPNIEIAIDFEKGKQVESKLKKVLDEIQSSTKGLKITVDDVALQSQLNKIDEATQNLANKITKNLGKISLSEAKKETDSLLQSMEGLIIAKNSSSKLLGSNVVTDSTTYKNNMEQSLQITNKINTANGELLETRIKTTNEIEKYNQAQSKLNENVYKELDAINKVKLAMKDKVDLLYKNDTVPRDLLQNVDKSIDNLDLGASATDIAKINNEIVKLVTLQKELNGQSKEKQKEISEVFKKEQEVKLTKELIDLEKKRLTTDISKMTNKRGSLLDEKDLPKRLADVRKAIDNLNGADTKEVRAEVAKLKAEMKDIDTVAESLGKMTGNKSRMSLWDGFKSTATKMGLAVSLYEVVGVMKQAVNHVIELNTAMTDLKKVTDDTQQSYDNFVQKMHEVSMVIGTQTTAMVQMATYWAKTGKTLEESAKLAESSAMLLKVGDNNNVEEVMQSMVAPLTAFNVEAKNSIEIVDKFNNTSNNMAVTTTKLGDALSRSASSLATAGNDINQSMALISTAMAKTQLSSEVVGTAMKSLSMRMATFKDDETGSPILKFAENMKKIGVEMYDVNGQIRSTYDILLDVSKVWGTLDRNTQMSTANLLGGMRQGNIVSAIVSDTQALEKAYKLSSDSAGSAMAEHAKYTESIQYSLDRAKETIQELFRAIVSDSGIKTLLDGFTSIVGVVGDLVEKFGAVNIAVAGVVTYMYMFNKSFQEGMMFKSIPFLGAMSKGFDNLRASIVGETVAQEVATVSTVKHTTATVGATLAQKAMTLSTYAFQMALTGGILLAITAVVTGLVKWADQAIVTREELKKLNEESVTTIKD
ncbi:MAG: phage tail tape measure protein, partial [Peptostreptococcaceae bacterium]